MQRERTMRRTAMQVDRRTESSDLSKTEGDYDATEQVEQHANASAIAGVMSLKRA
jgi:hypothetical protein